MARSNHSPRCSRNRVDHTVCRFFHAPKSYRPLSRSYLLSTLNAFPSKVQYNAHARSQVTLEGKQPYWKSPIWNVSGETADFFAP